MRQIILHLGIHKTATKFLQRSVFNNLSCVEYIDKIMINDDLMMKLLHKDLLSFQNEADIIRDEFLSLSKSNKLILLFSNELFSGNIFFSSNNRYILLLKLKTLFPDAKIIISIRGQRELIDSIYREYVVQGGCMKLESFISQNKPRGELSYHPSLDLDALKYGIYLDAITKLFGIDNCCILVYEMLLKDPEKYLNQIFTFIGESQNTKNFNYKKIRPSLNNSAIEFLRILNRLFYSAMSNKGILPYSYNPIKLIQLLKIFRNSKKKSQLFKPSIKLDFNKNNNYINKKYKLNLSGNFYDL
jgi:hypothetical protein